VKRLPATHHRPRRIAVLFLLLLQAALLTFAASPSHAGEDSITITAVGDIMMGSTYPFDALPSCDGTQIFGKVRQHLTGDIVFGNLEGPLADNVTPSKCRYSQTGSCFAFVTPERYGLHLRDAGFNVLNIANNHALDCGLYGAERTLAVLRNLGIEPCGGTLTVRTETKGRRIAVAGFSYKASEYALSILHIPEAQQKIRKLKEDNDIVIVSFHGGAEGHRAQALKKGPETFLGENRGDVMAFARASVDAGADIVIGHGPHVWRAMEIYKGKLIAYSLGNFLTHKLFNVKGPSGVTAILKVRLNAATGDFLDGAVIPLRLTSDGIPEDDDQRQVIESLRALNSQSFPTGDLVISDKGFLSRPKVPR
jgi:poly-gamma-glutamate capsule biosynthesis protein CapA/YwtB (metallophosphatase superfamily)